jgi:hypothetical protein
MGFQRQIPNRSSSQSIATMRNQAIRGQTQLRRKPDPLVNFYLAMIMVDSIVITISGILTARSLVFGPSRPFPALVYTLGVVTSHFLSHFLFVWMKNPCAADTDHRVPSHLFTTFSSVHTSNTTFVTSSSASVFFLPHRVAG